MLNTNSTHNFFFLNIKLKLFKKRLSQLKDTVNLSIER